MPQTIDQSRDVSTLPDLDPLFRWVTGPQAVAEAVARRLLTPRGALYGVREYGFDIRLLLNDAATSFRAAETLIVAEAELDDRVVRASARVTRNGDTIDVRVAMETVLGPAALTLAVDELNARIFVDDEGDV
jgi:hypothetical protein